MSDPTVIPDPIRHLLFLGGTCGNNQWRDEFTKALIQHGVPADVIFNPVVADWNSEARANEERAKRDATHLLFYIASPMLADSTLSAYSMVEATMGLYDKPQTVVVFAYEGIEGASLKSMHQTAAVLKARFPRAPIFDTADEALGYLVKELKPKTPPVHESAKICKFCSQKRLEHYMGDRSHVCSGFEAL